jgi:hypothetical protein
MKAGQTGERKAMGPDVAVQSVETVLVSTEILLMAMGSGLFTPSDRQSIGHTCF